MKPLLFILLLLLIPVSLLAPDAKRLILPANKPICPYEAIMSAVLQVESGGDSLAFNPVELAYGPFQIRPIRVEDYRMRTGKSYSMTDCFRTDVSREIFTYYASQIGPYDIERIAKQWNGSGSMTEDYWKKVSQILYP